MSSVTTVDDTGKKILAVKTTGHEKILCFISPNSNCRWYKIANFHCFKGAKQETAALDKEIKNCCIASSPNAWVNFENKLLGTFSFCCVILYGTQMNVKLKIL